MIVIGSLALNHRLSYQRQCRDTDLVCSYDEFDQWVKKQENVQACYPIDKGKKMVVKKPSDIYEFEIAWDDSTAKSFIELVEADSSTEELSLFELGNVKFPSLDALYALKMSHRFLKNSPHFLKTMKDIDLMRAGGAKIPEKYQSWYKERQKATYTYSHPNLNQNKANFFDLNQGVRYFYDHDSVHLAMAQLDKPAYLYYKAPGAEVMCDKKAFFAAPEEVRLSGVIEEAYVLALERSQIPFKGKVDPKRSFDIALEKVATSITSGWFREYAYDNYFKVQSLYDPQYVDRFWSAVDAGTVLRA